MRVITYRRFLESEGLQHWTVSSRLTGTILNLLF